MDDVLFLVGGVLGVFLYAPYDEPLYVECHIYDEHGDLE